MSVDRDILIGFAQLIHNAGAGVYRPTGGYLPNERAIVFGELPTTPDTAIGLTLYTSSDEVKENRSERRIQVWCRGAQNDTLSANDIASDIFDAVQGRENFEMGAVHVIDIHRVSFLPQGQDTSKRSERADNYGLRVNTPNTIGRPAAY